MSAKGFTLRGLRWIGPAVPSAELCFERGLNVVSGASDTGKSYVVECLDYMLGGGDTPRQIPEAQGYAELLLALEDTSGTPLTLRRSIGGGRFRLVRAGLDAAENTPSAEVLSDRHKRTGTDSVSGLLLELSGLRSALIVPTASTESRPVSFREILPQALITESMMFKYRPVYRSEQYTTSLLEASVFRLLIAGSGVWPRAPRTNPKTAKLRANAQIELLDELIQTADAELRRLDAIDDINATLARLDDSIAAASAVQTSAQTRLEQIELEAADRRQVRNALVIRTTAVDALLARFDLLRQQYESDRARLTAVIETEYFFAQLRADPCPLCGAPEPHQDHDHIAAPQANFRDAAVAEAEKLATRLSELVATSAFLSTERAALATAITREERVLAALRTSSEGHVAVTVRTASEELARLHARRTELLRGAQLRTQLESLRAVRAAAGPKPAITPTNEAFADLVALRMMRDLCDCMAGLLQAWHFPGDGSVRFDGTSADFVVSGKERANYGKGHRAVAYAAFAISLMLHARDAKVGHPGFVILDSPLVTRRKKDVPPGEAVSDELKNAFFEHLAAILGGGQVLVFENELPPTSIAGPINHEHLSGDSKIGRAGVFPV